MYHREFDDQKPLQHERATDAVHCARDVLSYFCGPIFEITGCWNDSHAALEHIRQSIAILQAAQAMLLCQAPKYHGSAQNVKLSTEADSLTRDDR